MKGFLNPLNDGKKAGGYNNSGISILNRNHSNNGPVKIQTNSYLRKPMTPDTTTITMQNK